MIEGVGGHKQTEMWKQLQKFMTGGHRPHKMYLKLIQDLMHINWEMICQVLPEGLGKMRICMQFVLYSLMDEQKEHRGTICEDLSDQSTLFQLYQILQYDSATKCRIME